MGIYAGGSLVPAGSFVNEYRLALALMRGFSSRGKPINAPTHPSNPTIYGSPRSLDLIQFVFMPIPREGTVFTA
jgi:hypothetical protein